MQGSEMAQVATVLLNVQARGCTRSNSCEYGIGTLNNIKNRTSPRISFDSGSDKSIVCHMNLEECDWLVKSFSTSHPVEKHFHLQL